MTTGNLNFVIPISKISAVSDSFGKLSSRIN